MSQRFAQLAFTDTVKSYQTAAGSRASYGRMEAGPPSGDLFGPPEAEFIAARDSFYMATVSEIGWPYVQHRGGPVGFVKVLDERTLGFADFRGNRQYVSVGNLSKEDRLSLFFMDYANRQRLKILGRVRLISREDSATLAQLALPDYRAQVERGMIVTLDGFDWNCPQHITPRFTTAEIASKIDLLTARIAELESEVARLRVNSASWEGSA